jgi:hypothetical protein
LRDKIYNKYVFGANAPCPGRDKMLVEKTREPEARSLPLEEAGGRLNLNIIKI